MGDIWIKIDKDVPYPERILTLARNLGVIFMLLLTLAGFAADLLESGKRGFSLGGLGWAVGYGLLYLLMSFLRWLFERQSLR